MEVINYAHMVSGYTTEIQISGLGVSHTLTPTGLENHIL